MAHLMAGLFESHDRKRFETFAFSFGPDVKSEVRTRLKAAFDRFIDVREISDRDVAIMPRVARSARRATMRANHPIDHQGNKR